ncbi:MAG: 16S rRNA (guanine(966)-N(2))-methyltransferase RsmD [Candidatus Kapaibacterium sp.]
MRIISGEWKGKKLPAVLPAGVRPTLDAARETIFNILNNHVEFEGASVCDICAGSGALGFEALSRGAVHVTFVEKNKRVIAVLQANAKSLGVESDRFTIVHSDAVQFVQQHRGVYGVVFADPPYAERICNQIIHGLDTNAMIDEGGVIVAEHASFETLLLADDLECFSSRNFGDTVVDFVKRM